MKSFLAKARSWTASRKLFGSQAFLRYVMLHFLENLNTVSKDFVFKGGNLLWLYIETPRATIDLDLATLVENQHERVRETLEKACKINPDISYEIKEFNPIENDCKNGSAVTVLYKTKEGAKTPLKLILSMPCLWTLRKF